MDLPVKGNVFIGSEFEAMCIQQRRAVVVGETGKVFACVEPSHKSELGKSLIELGNVVAMTGDG